VGKDQFKGEIFPKFLWQWEENLVSGFKVDAVAENEDNKALLELSDRLEKLNYSFGFKLSEKKRK
jgi:hypothetical protein